MNDTNGELSGLELTTDQIADAWTYVFGRYLVIRQEHLDLAEEGVEYNAIKHNPPVLSGVEAGEAPTFVNPNLDVVYSEAWIAVDESTATVLEVPEIPEGTYYTAQIVDEWAEITYNINDRTFPEKPHGKFAFCLEGTEPAIPDDATRLTIPSRKAKLLARVEIGNDVDAAASLQRGFAMESSGAPEIEPAVEIESFTNQEPPGTMMFVQPRLEQALAPPDRSGHADEFRPALDAISAFVAEDPSHAQAFDELVRTKIFPGLIYAMTHMPDVGNGWRSTGNRTGFGDDWRFRTIANFGGIWWNSATEVIYYPLQADETGSALTGDHHYAIRFPAGESPGEHVDGYWSLTLYSHPDVRLVPNPLGKYSIGNQTDLRADDDGGFTIHIAPEQPDGVEAANWLPSTPPGKAWAIVMRLYLPRADVLDGSWTPPPLVTLD